MGGGGRAGARVSSGVPAVVVEVVVVVVVVIVVAVLGRVGDVYSWEAGRPAGPFRFWFSSRMEHKNKDTEQFWRIIIVGW